MSDWTDAIVADRMAVDREFNQRVRNSEFSNQQWNLIMTAIEFDIEHADDPDAARIVPNTEKLPQIMPELETVEQAGPMGGPQESSGGIGEAISNVKDALLGGGGSDGPDPERIEAAERLAREYADTLQDHLESKGKWDQVRIAYQE